MLLAQLTMLNVFHKNKAQIMSYKKHKYSVFVCPCDINGGSSEAARSI